MRRNAIPRLALATMLVIVGPRAAGAIGHYVAGVMNARDFFMPPPGVYLANYTSWYGATTFKDRNGQTVDDFTVQMGANTGRDVAPFRTGVLDQVHAAGLQIGLPKLGSLHYLHEFGARARFQGQTLTFTFGVPLDKLFVWSRVRPGVTR